MELQGPRSQGVEAHLVLEGTMQSRARAGWSPSSTLMASAALRLKRVFGPALRGQNPRVECLLPCPSPQRHNGAQELAPRVTCSGGTAGRKRADRGVRGVDIHHRPLEQPRRGPGPPALPTRSLVAPSADPVHTRRSTTEPRRASWAEGASPEVHWAPANVAPTRVRARTRPPSTNLLEPFHYRRSVPLDLYHEGST